MLDHRKPTNADSRHRRAHYPVEIRTMPSHSHGNNAAAARIAAWTGQDLVASGQGRQSLSFSSVPRNVNA